MLWHVDLTISLQSWLGHQCSQNYMAGQMKDESYCPNGSFKITCLLDDSGFWILCDIFFS